LTIDPFGASWTQKPNNLNVTFANRNKIWAQFRKDVVGSSEYC